MPDEIVKLCECGCGKPAPIAKMTNRRDGAVKGQPQRFIVNHHLREARRCKGPAHRIDVETGCWVWTRYLNPSGYGQMTINKRSVRAYRWYYQLYVGPIPRGMQIDHVCRNRACVNPDHLRLATNAQNAQNKATEGLRRYPRGVIPAYPDRKIKWGAQVVVDGKRYARGGFKTMEEAAEAAARMRAELMPFSQDARRIAS